MGPYRPAPRTESKAIASLVLGVSSLFCLGAITGLPAVVLGALARKDIDRSSGSLTGRGIAAGGIMSGLFGTGLGFVMLLFVLGGVLEDTKPGALQVVDLREDRSFAAQMRTVVDDAKVSHRTVLLQTHSAKDVRCAQIAAALPDARVQRALANVTLVRVDVDRYSSELLAMHIETKSAPYFYVLDEGAVPVDAMSGREVDPSAPEKMGPTLAAFARGATEPKVKGR
jgi:hypothetical protein